MVMATNYRPSSSEFFSNTIGQSRIGREWNKKNSSFQSKVFITCSKDMIKPYVSKNQCCTLYHNQLLKNAQKLYLYQLSHVQDGEGRLSPWEHLGWRLVGMEMCHFGGWSCQWLLNCGWPSMQMYRMWAQIEKWLWLITKAVSYSSFWNEAHNLCEVDAISIVLWNNHN